MGIVIDSSIFVAAERGLVNFDEYLQRHPKEDFAISVITASELLHGVHRASPKFRLKREAFVEGLLAQLPVIPFTLVCARIHAALWSELATKGKVIGAHDLLVAATAVAHDLQVLTRDKRSFPTIPNLKVVVL